MKRKSISGNSKAFLWICFSLLVAWRQGLAATERVRPVQRPIQSFSGKDLSGFYVWLRDTKREDPRRVVTVTNGVIRISGDGLGYLSTEKECEAGQVVLITSGQGIENVSFEFSDLVHGNQRGTIPRTHCTYNFVGYTAPTRITAKDVLAKLKGDGPEVSLHRKNFGLPKRN